MTPSKLSETQRLSPVWRVALLVLCLIVLYFKWSNEPNLSEKTGTLLVDGSIVVLLNVFIYMIKLTIKVEGHRMYYKLFPLQLKYSTINLDAIQKMKIQEVNLLSWGGLGLRYNPFNNTTGYIIAGKQGVAIELNNGKKYVFTLKNPQALINSFRVSAA